MKREEFIGKWTAERDEFCRLRSLVDGAKLLDDVLQDFTTVTTGAEPELLTLREAAELSGYTRQHLARLIQQGKLKNYGRPNAPRVRRGDLPIKPGYLPPGAETANISNASRGQIVRSIVRRR